MELCLSLTSSEMAVSLDASGCSKTRLFDWIEFEVLVLVVVLVVCQIERRENEIKEEGKKRRENRPSPGEFCFVEDEESGLEIAPQKDEITNVADLEINKRDDVRLLDVWFRFLCV